MSDLKVGDVVYLKSGGPAMTVNTMAPVIGKKAFVCVWFVESENKSATFLPEALTTVNPNPSKKPLAG